MSKGRSVIRYIAYIIEILVLYIINGTPNLIPEFFGGKPVLLVAVAITIAIFESEISAMVLGLLCGILLDFGISDTLGFYSVILPVIC
ncbi:MAG: rod shape-determining protein MreD, partial [Acutalibacteraceae bacterium]